jgi:hypothetical protein
MSEYRLFFVTKDGHIERPSVVLTCNEDQEAILQAEQFKDNLDIEIWCGAAIIGRIKSSDTAQAERNTAPAE